MNRPDHLRLRRKAPHRRLPALVLALALLCHSTSNANPAPRYEAFIDKAANRFGLPPSWINAVIVAESGGDVRALSPKGAMGLMQLMPQTYRELRARFALADDPFDPHDNIMAGSAYLRRMWDQFGSSGFLLAYNAGPGRYQSYLRTHKPLPAESVRYAQIVGRWIGQPAAPPSFDSPGWRQAPLFISHSSRTTTGSNSQQVDLVATPSTAGASLFAAVTMTGTTK